MAMKVAYVAGPYRAKSIHGVAQNIRAAGDVARKYWLLGYAVICPHFNTAFMDGEDTDDIFLNGDLEMIRRIDTMVMMSNWEKSTGARGEHALAVKLGKEIIYE